MILSRWPIRQNIFNALSLIQFELQAPTTYQGEASETKTQSTELRLRCGLILYEAHGCPEEYHI